MNEFDVRVQSTMSDYRAWCADNNVTVTPDGRVGELDASRLLGYGNPGSLKNLRQQGFGPPHYLRVVAGAKVSYRLSDLARWVEKSRNEE